MIEEILPLSPLQEGLLFQSLYSADGAGIYNVQIVLKIDETLDEPALRESLQALVRRHTTLRTVFRHDGLRRPVQVVIDDVQVPWEAVDLAGHDSEDNGKAELQRWLDRDLSTKFKLEKAPPLRATLIRLKPPDYRLVLTTHHAVMDGWSLAILIRELDLLYRNRADVSVLPAVTPYRAYLEWVAAQDRESARKAWKEELSGLQQPTRIAGPGELSGAIDSIDIKVTDALTARLKQLARNSAVTLNTATQAAVAILLSRLTGNTDVVFGTTVSGRVPEIQGIENMVGLFINTVPVRVQLRRAESFLQLLRRIQRQQSDLVPHQHMGLAEIQQVAGLGTLFDTLLVFENQWTRGNTNESTATSSVVRLAAVRDPNHFPLSLSVAPRRCLEIRIDYRTDLLHRDAVEAIKERLLLILDAVSNNPEQPVGRIDILNAAEREYLLRTCNRTFVDAPSERTVPELFDKQMACAPDKIALVDNEHQVTYADLYRRSNLLAAELRRRGVSTEQLVAVCMEPSVAMVAALLAVLRSGGAYVPLDGEYPQQRLLYMLLDAAPMLGLGDRHTKNKLGTLAASANIQVIDVEELTAVEDAVRERIEYPSAENLAYTIYTSGSTGRPKGVQVTHRALVNCLHSMRRQLEFEAGDRLLSVTTISFDVAGLELWLPLTTGASLQLAGRDERRDGPALGELLERGDVTLMQGTPSTWRLLLESGWDNGERVGVLCGGETLPADLARQLRRSGCGFWNAYGPTETTIWSTLYRIENEKPGVRIGRPIANTQVYVLDDGMQPTPVGVAGELYIAGAGLSRGYWNAPALTAARFVANPFADTGKRLYRTGDQVRWDSAGQLEFLGRADTQIKIRGHRVELDEIAQALRELHGVKDAVAALRDETGVPRLVAYVALKSREDETKWPIVANRLQEELRTTLPDYMVPTAVIVMEALPRTPNGKLDLRALPEALPTVAPSRQPRTPEEYVLCSLIAQVLGLPRVGAEDNFFHIGGDSLRSIEVVGRARQCGVEIRVQDIFQLQTVEKLAGMLRAASGNPAKEVDSDNGPETELAARPLVTWLTQEQVEELKAENPRMELLPLSPLQGGLLFHALYASEGADAYNQQLIIHLAGSADEAEVKRVLKTLVQRHASLRACIRHRGLPRPVQMICDDVDLPWQRLDLPAGATEEERVRLFDKWLDDDRAAPFDPSHAPVLRAALIAWTSTDYRLVVTSHHLIVDGWSLAVLIDEFRKLYRNKHDDKAIPAVTPYRKFFEWIAAQDREEARAAWQEALAGLEEPTRLARSDQDSGPLLPKIMKLTSDQTDALRQTARACGVTLNTVVQASIAILLSRLTGRDDVTAGTTVSGRPPDVAGMERMVGLFINTVPLRVRLSRSETVRQFLQRIQQEQAALIAHQYFSLPEIHQIAGINPLFDLLLVFESQPANLDTRNALVPKAYNRLAGFRNVNHYPLSILVAPTAQLQFSVAYRADLFTEESVGILLDELVTILETVAASPGELVTKVEALRPDQRKQLLHGWNGEFKEINPSTVGEMCEQAAELYPDAVALVCAEQSFSYRELNQQSNRLANYLIARDVKPEDVVALATGRSFETVVGLIAIMKARGVYLAIDVTYPASRLVYILNNASAHLVLTLSSFAESLPAGKTPVLNLDREWEHIAQESAENPKRRPRPGNVAYATYTSGSTGRPKGVVVTHEGIPNLARAQVELFDVRRESRVMQFASMSFDASVSEVMMVLASAATLVLISDNEKSGRELAGALREHAITHVTLPPAVLETLKDGDCPSLETLIVAGEACSAELAKKWSDTCRMVNAYGPTEATVCVTVTGALTGWNKPPIGKPIWNTNVYVLDQNLNPVPVGVTGELYVSSRGLARGYLKAPAPTAERFVSDPYGKPGQRMYRTGDRVQWRSDGQLDFVGRSDSQVKIRGYRIELGEIEHVLKADERVCDAVVMVQADASGEKLVGYVIKESVDNAVDEKTLKQDLHEKLKRTLPDYMVPAALVVLDRWPLTANGKLDRKNLPKAEPESTSVRREARTPEEEILCGLFAEILGIDSVGVDENFFELGGHSLLATRLGGRISGVLGIDLANWILFESPTVAELAQRLREGGVGRPELKAGVRPKQVPLSFAQERLWFIDRMEGGASREYNVVGALRLRGSLNGDALEKAINTIVERHESLRTHFEEVDGEAAQVIDEEVRIEVPMEDWSRANEEEQKERVREAIRREGEEAFDLRHGPVLRMKLLKLGEAEYILLQAFHHIVVDAWSQGVFNRELTVLYEAYTEGYENPLRPLPVQYADFAIWQRNWLEQGTLEEGLEYWKKQLEGIPERLELPADRPRPAVQTFEAKVCQATLDEEKTGRLKKLSQEKNATLYMTLLAAFGVLLSRYSGEDDIVVGTPIVNRQEAQLEQMIGFFVNALVMRMRMRSDLTFDELLMQVRQTTLEAYRHQDVPFERLVEALAPVRSLSTSPLFQTLFSLQNEQAQRIGMRGLSVQPISEDVIRVRFDLELHVSETRGRLGIWWFYNCNLFAEARIEQMASHYLRVLESIMDDCEQPLGRIRILTEKDRFQVPEGWNATDREIDHSTVPQLFELQAERSPRAVALMCGERSLSYGELNEHVNRLANYLIKTGVGPEDVVAVALPRSTEAIVGLLGVIKAGAAYLPLNTDEPLERLSFMLSDTNPKCIVTNQDFSLRLPHRSDVVILDRHAMSQALAASSSSNPTDHDRTTPLRTTHPAYLLYTSGSTGIPKAVCMPYKGLRNLLAWHASEIPGGTGTKVAQFTVLSFDVSIQEILSALVTGKTLIVVPDDFRRDPARLVGWLSSQSVNELYAPALVLDALCAAAGEIPVELHALTEVVQAGEALSLGGDIRRLFRNGEKKSLRNHYGPTETHVATTCKLPNDPLEWELSAPIGSPVWNTRTFVLDSMLEPVPVGLPGELYVAGDQVARGYVKRPALTAERFVANPYGAVGERMYRTGDRVRWRADGQLQFLGRTDYQLKIRGYRIEPTEVEDVLKQHERVLDAVVLGQEGPTGLRLVGYVIATGDKPQEHVLKNELYQKLKRTLPDYMAPAALVVLDRWPLTANGKLDRKNLPKAEPESTSVRREARTPEEEILCGLFAEILGIDSVGIDENFFESGGHSLLVTRLTSRIRAMLGVEVQIRTLFESPTVAELAQRLREGGVGRPELKAGVRPKQVPLSFAQERLWFIDRMEGGASREYNVVGALRLRGSLNGDALEKAINTIVERHESLRTHFEEVDGEAAQVIDEEVRIEVPMEDWSRANEEEQKERVREAIRREGEEAFDLRHGPVLRMKLLKLGEAEYILLQAFHHIVVDAWSQGVFNRELTVLYEAYTEGYENPLRPLPVQYADFAIWQRNWLEQGTLEEGLEYWKKQLEGIPERLELPADRPRPAVQTFEAKVCQATLDEEKTGRLKKLSQEKNATLYMTLLAAFGVLLSRYSGEDDIVVGTPIANRQEAQQEQMIGFFVNALVMRMRMRSDLTFDELLMQVRQTTLEAYRHQDVPFERLVEALAPVRSLSTTPLFQVHFAMHNVPYVSPKFENLTVEPVASVDPKVRLDLEVHTREAHGRLEISFIYNKDLFDRETVDRIKVYYTRLLESLTTNSAQPLGRMEMLTDEERLQLLRRRSETEHTASGSTVVRLFELEACRHPDITAVVCGVASMSYGELNARANRLAHYLMKLGIGPERVVALALGRSLEMIIGFLAVMKSGGAYLPLDLDDPIERLAYMLEDAQANVVLTVEGVESRLPSSWAHTAYIDRDWEEISLESPEIPRKTAVARNGAYVIYTSGSTGRPKGVLVTNEGIPNLALAQAKSFGIARGSRVLQFASMSFDASVSEFLTALITGATLVLVGTEERTGDRLRHVIVNHDVTHATLPPAVIGTLEAPDRLPLETIVTAGDLCAASLINQWCAGRRMINAYGPTETTVCVTMSAPLTAAEDPVPIGKPIANTGVYVLDDTLSPAPAGVPGELYVSGRNLARGYIRQPALTSQRFVSDPYGNAGERMYRTGDRVKWRTDGQLEFLGRRDDQVKIRGCRIDLGEIETALRADDRVRDAVVTVHGTEHDKRLDAYIVPRSTGDYRLQARAAHVAEWQKIHESTSWANEGADADFNIAGWCSSYTGESLPRDEMEIWVDETVKRIQRLNPKNVLDIGCGTGLLLTRLAAGCDQYVGIDFSAKVLDQLRSYVNSRDDLRHASLRYGPAHELSFVQEESMDVVILNSVVQYFPDVEYLLEVLKQAESKLRPGGYLFLGDIRILPLLGAYHTSVQLHKSSDEASIEDLRRRIRKALRNEKELAVDTRLFEEWCRRSKKIGCVEVLPKAGNYDNELSRFRCDVLMQVCEKKTLADPQRWTEWSDDGEWRQVVQTLLTADPTSAVGVKGVVDLRAASSLKAARLLDGAAGAPATVGELKALSTAATGEIPDQVIAFAGQLGLCVAWRVPPGAGTYCAIFNPLWIHLTEAADDGTEHSREFCNAPCESVEATQLADALRGRLEKVLPAYAIPASITTLPSLPLNSSGKADRQALPRPEPSVCADDYQAPRTEVEKRLCELFATVTGVERVGATDNFFNLGGHSIMATRLISRIRSAWGVDLAIGSVFEFPNVGELAAVIEEELRNQIEGLTEEEAVKFTQSYAVESPGPYVL